MNNISVFDTTLRDGEQSPGSAITIEKKIEIARQLWRLNVDVIEAGFPVASAADFDAVKEISDELSDITICAFARAVERDIKTAAAALNGNDNGRIQIVTPVSDLHLETRLHKNRKQGLELIRNSIRIAKELSAEVAWIAEDSSRADPDYLLEAFDIAVQSGAKIVTYADTVGYALPDEVSHSIKSIVKTVGQDVVIGIHCHNDLGLAVSNTLAAVSAGAREVQCTINGIGERAGNAALEEVVMALQVRNKKFNATTNIDARLLTLTSGLVSQYTKLPVPKNKPVVGENAFAHCSGMHQHGVLACPENYEVMSPEYVGAKQRKILIGRHSGHHGVMHILEEQGCKITPEILKVLMGKIKNDIADDKYLSVEELIEMKDEVTKNQG